MTTIFRNQLDGFFWLFISVFVCAEGISSKIGTFHSRGPGFLPFWTGIILGSLSIILIITNILKKKEEKVTNLWEGAEWGKVCLVLLSLYMYSILLTKVGYLITTFGLMVILFGIKDRPKLWIHALTALITVLITYVIFYVCLKVLLPRGIFGF